jgi:hypothetical protein
MLKKYQKFAYVGQKDAKGIPVMKNGSPVFVEGEAIGHEITLTDDHAATLNLQAENTGVIYKRVVAKPVKEEVKK